MLRAGDTGTMVSKAVLSAGNPEGDVMSASRTRSVARRGRRCVRAVRGGRADAVPAALRELTPDGEATPIDFGDVCVNYDMAWFGSGARPPADLAALADRRTPNSSSSRTRRRRRPGSRSSWRRSPSTARTGGSTTGRSCATTACRSSTLGGAYYGAFSGAGDGDRPLVVSYGRAPRPRSCSPTADRRGDDRGRRHACFRQIEYAGVLRGTEHAEVAGQLVDFLLAEPFQSELPLNLFVYPANADVALPEVFTANAIVPAEPKTLDPAAITPTARRGWRRGPTRSCADRRAVPSRLHALAARCVVALTALPVAFLLVFYAWPFATLLGRGLSPGAIGDVLGRGATWEIGVVHAVAGRGKHGADGVRRARAGLRVARFSFPGRRLRRRSTRRSCCRRSSLAPLALLPDALGARRAGDPLGPRPVQPRRRRAHGRRRLAAAGDEDLEAAVATLGAFAVVCVFREEVTLLLPRLVAARRGARYCSPPR